MKNNPEVAKKSAIQYKKSKQLQGWKYINALLPPDIQRQVLAYKCYLMAQRSNIK